MVTVQKQVPERIWGPSSETLRRSDEVIDVGFRTKEGDSCPPGRPRRESTYRRVSEVIRRSGHSEEPWNQLGRDEGGTIIRFSFMSDLDRYGLF